FRSGGTTPLFELFLAYLVISNAIPVKLAGPDPIPNLPSVGPVQWVLYLRNFADDDVLQLAVNLLHLADIDGLHVVARIGVDAHRAARALPRHALGGFDQRVAGRIAIRGLQRLVDQVHAVITADREQVGAAAVV